MDNYTIRNLARSPLSRVARKTRAGGRYTSFILEDGSKIRRSGARGSPISLEKMKLNVEYLLQGIKDGFVEILDPAGKVLTLEQLHRLTIEDAPIPIIKTPEPMTKVIETPKVEVQVEKQIEKPVEAVAETPAKAESTSETTKETQRDQDHKFYSGPKRKKG